MKYQGLREIRKVTEYRNSEGQKAIFKTKHIGYAWVNIDIPCYQVNENDEMFCSVSTTIMAIHKTNRSVNDDTADVVSTELNISK